MKKVYLVFESCHSWKFPRLCGVFSSHDKAKKCVDDHYSSRFDVLCNDPNSKVSEFSYYYQPFFVN